MPNPPTSLLAMPLALHERGASSMLLLELQELRRLLSLGRAVDRALAYVVNLQLATTLAELCTPAVAAIYQRKVGEPEEPGANGEAALCQALWGARESLAPPAPESLRPGLSWVELAAWAEAHRVGHWLLAPAAAALPRHGLPSWLIGGRSLAAVACARREAGAVASDGREVPTRARLRAQAQHLALGCLAERADAARRGAASHAARAVGRRAPQDPGLAGLYAAAVAARARLAGGLPPRPATELRHARVSVTKRPAGLRWQLSKQTANACGAGADVRLWRDASGLYHLRCSCARDERTPGKFDHKRMSQGALVEVPGNSTNVARAHGSNSNDGRCFGPGNPVDPTITNDAVRLDMAPRPCEAQIEAVERFADLLSSTHAKNRRRLSDLSAGLGAPAWRQAVDQLFDAAQLHTHLPKTLAGQPARFVWRLHVRGGRARDLGPAMVAPRPRPAGAAPATTGGGLHLRSLSVEQLSRAEDDLSSPTDRAVFALVRAARTAVDATAAFALYRQAAELLIGAGHVVADGAYVGPAQVRRVRVGVAVVRAGARCRLVPTLDDQLTQGEDADPATYAAAARAATAAATALHTVLTEDAGLHWDASSHTLELLSATGRVRRLLAAWRERAVSGGGPGGMVADFPLSALPHLRERLGAVADPTLAVAPSARGVALRPDATPRLRLALRPSRHGGQGLRVELLMRPVAGGALVIPTRGPELVYAERAAASAAPTAAPVTSHAVRDFAAERQAADGLWAILGLPPIDPLDLDAPPLSHTNPWVWQVDDPDQALDLIAVIEARYQAVQSGDRATLAATDGAAHGPAEVLWQGAQARVVGRATGHGLRVELLDKRDWFELKGAMKGAAHAVPLQALLEALRAGRRHVQVADTGDWLAITDAVRQALLPVAIASRDGRISPLAAPMISALEELDAHVSGPAEWLRLADRVRAAATMATPVPAGLRAELRPYQRAGLAWLQRLATWAPGAVLADDMGLGKTVQALALLLHRAELGPALVVAPTSVLTNWQREAERFAPTLRVRALRGQAQLGVLDDVTAGVVVVTTWDLLARHHAPLTAQGWATVVFDEAQALKNPTTRRARAAYGLQAGFRLALTGTPLENRTDELWSLLRATTPGLLGGRRDFRARFAVPVERYQDPGVRATLATLIKPFVLRRMKHTVATELPARQDVVLPIELPAETRQRYDALRTSLAASLHKKLRRERGDAGQGAGRGRIEVLAALTRLRQLACHPRLLDAESNAPPAKVLALRAHLAELRAEGHQALVFSQFTSLLDLVRPALAADGLRVLQLDGRTPSRERQGLVDRFQAGEADVFLLSIKAGGTGLNLTAASYVFHLDPWWNPAVEDQATDRAHRLGQRRPVTVYRLVAQGTVEEAIYALHRDKRDLATSLLAGATDQGDGGDEALPPSLSITDLEALVVYSGQPTHHHQRAAVDRANSLEMQGQ